MPSGGAAAAQRGGPHLRGAAGQRPGGGGRAAGAVKPGRVRGARLHAQDPDPGAAGAGQVEAGFRSLHPRYPLSLLLYTSPPAMQPPPHPFQPLLCAFLTPITTHLRSNNQQKPPHW